MFFLYFLFLCGDKPNQLSTYKPDIDPLLLKLLQQGDHAAFEKLFMKYGQKLFAFSLSYLKNEDEAEEIVQDVFLKIWHNRSMVRTDTSFQSYLFTIAFNAVKKSFNRKAKDDQFKLEIIDQLDSEQETCDFEQNYRLMTKKLELFIEEMPERRKAIFLQRKQEGKSLKEIAERLDISVKTVENQITEAMKYLKKRFEEEHPGGLLFLMLFAEK